jgi:hypothetical protein
MECRDLLSRTHREITRIRELKSQLAALQPRFEDSDLDYALQEALIDSFNFPDGLAFSIHFETCL